MTHVGIDFQPKSAKVEGPASTLPKTVLAPVKTPPNHQNHFNLIRDALALLVILSHSYLLLGKSDSEPLRILTMGQVDGGFVAVSLFLAVSGYLVTASLLRSKSTFDYLSKRFLRIYPALFVTLLASLFIAGPLGGMSLSDFVSSREPYQFIYRPLMLRDVWLNLPDFCASNPLPCQLNSSLWTIRFEIVCYLLLILLAKANFLAKRWLLLTLLAVVLVSTKGTAVDLNNEFWGRLGEFTRLIVYFLSGACIYLFRDRIVFNKKLVGSSLLAICIATPLRALTLVFPIAGCYLLFSLAFSRVKITSNWIAKNDISYGLYLYAWPIQQLLVRNSHNAQSPEQLFLSASCITALVAFASWKLVEKPCLKFKTLAR